MAIKNKRARYKKGKRVDYRQGGRVSFQKGGGKNKKKDPPFDPNLGQPPKDPQVSPDPNVGQTPPPISTATEDTVKVYGSGPKGGGTPQGPSGPGGVGGPGGPKGPQTSLPPAVELNGEDDPTDRPDDHFPPNPEIDDTWTDPDTGVQWIFTATGWQEVDDDTTPTEGSINPDTGFVYTNGAWVRPSDISATVVWNVATQSWEEPAATTTTTTTATPSDEMARKLAEEAAKGGGPQDKAIIADPEKVGGFQVDAEGNPILDPVTGEKIPVIPEMEKTEFDALTDDQKAKAAKAGGFRMNAAGTDYERYPAGHPKAGQAIPIIEPEAVTTGTVAPDVEAGEIEAATYDAATITGQTPEVTAAIKDLTDGLDPNAKATVDEIVTLTSQYINQGMPSDEALEKAKANSPTFIKNPESVAPFLDRLNQITAAIIPGPVAETREGQVITAEEEADILSRVTKEGTNLDDLGTYQKAAARTAQTGDAASRIATELGTAPSTDADQREGITGTAPQGDAAQIGGIPTAQAASMQAVTNTEERVAAAADMLAVVGEVSPEIAKAVSEDPATLEAQLDTDPDPNNVAAIAALPEEALVSVQMENLLSGIEAGTTPVWARPAVDAVNQMMADRGLEVSTVGRDALFNAIIQTALPMAQSNAQALQARATQNLSNQQQANLAQSQQTMQLRMENLGNKQIAASQTAQMAQQIKVQQGTFTAQAVTQTAAQQQQTRMQQTQGEQQRQAQISAQKQQAAVATFSADIQKDLADLQFLNASAKENMTADQQVRLTEYNAKIAKTMRQADLDQEMAAANLSADLQVELKNLTEMNATDRASMSEENKVRLANLGVLVDFSKTNAAMSQQMKLANMNNEQQMELAELSDKAATDTANFTADNQFRLQELTTTATVLSQNTELRTRAELAQMSASEKVALANLTAKNQADSESMNAENVAELARYDKQMNAAQFNANLAKEMGLAQLSNDQNTTLFNAQINANIDMAKFNTEERIAMSNSKFMQTTTLQDFSQRHQGAMQNAAAMASIDLATVDQRTKLAVTNAQNFLAYDMSNLDKQQQANVLEAQMQQQALLSDQAATNASLQFNATSENQTNQFMTNLAAQIDLNNVARNDNMTQFNATQENAAEARRLGVEADINKFNSQLTTQVSEFNANQDFARNQWLAQNSEAVEASNTQWRRNTNLANTAAQNTVNMQNSMNAFNLSQTASSFLWQEMRDQADYNFREAENDKNRIAQLVNTAIANDPSKYGSTTALNSLITAIIGDITTGGG